VKKRRAFTFPEGIVWPDGTECPHCGIVGCGLQDRGDPYEARSLRPLENVPQAIHVQGSRGFRATLALQAAHLPATS